VPLAVASLVLALFIATVDPTADWLGRASGPVVLGLVIVALLRGTLVTGREADGLRAERDKALELVYKQAEVAQRALEVSEKK
jgi:hypothetical protein